MASLQDAHFHIVRDTLEAGSICEIQYRYVLHCDKREIELGVSFDCCVVLWGQHIVGDEPLGSGAYDVHRLKAGHSLLELQRQFVVPCDILNEAVGLDEIFLTIICRSSSGEEITIQTPSVRDHF